MKTFITKTKTEKANSNNTDKTIKIDFFFICVWIFVIGCLIGYFVEVIYAYFKHGHYINKQGMIYGPFNQVYGFGALIITLFLYKLRESKVYIIFLISAVVGGVFEFVCSYIQELIFKSESWHYSKFPLSINGRTNPIHAAFWGALGVVFILHVFPMFIDVFESIPEKLKAPLTWFMFVFMVVNLLISACAVHRQSQRFEDCTSNSIIDVFLDKHYDDAKSYNFV